MKSFLILAFGLCTFSFAAIGQDFSIWQIIDIYNAKTLDKADKILEKNDYIFVKSSKEINYDIVEYHKNISDDQKYSVTLYLSKNELITSVEFDSYKPQKQWDFDYYKDQLENHSYKLAKTEVGYGNSIEYSYQNQVWSIRLIKKVNEYFYANSLVSLSFNNIEKKEDNDNLKVVRQDNNSFSADTALIENYDIGFDPFYGKTIKNVNFRELPTTRSKIIKKLNTGERLYVFSKQDISGFYKVIEIKSGKIGWISKTFIKETEKAKVNEAGDFQDQGTSDTYESEILIKNQSSYSISLIIGNQTEFLMPNSTKTILLKPMKFHYIASAPNVNPTSGYQTFDSYHKYEWKFWVETHRY
jgi:hypothetical protein